MSKSATSATIEYPARAPASRSAFDTSSTSSAAEITLPWIKTYSKLAGSTEKLGSAVYAYIRAMRSLGRTRVTTSEIASALDIAETDVVTAIAGLTKKGVKILE